MIGQTHKQTNRDYNFIYINKWILAWEPSFVWKIKLDTKIQGMVMKNTGSRIIMKLFSGLKLKWRNKRIATAEGFKMSAFKKNVRLY